MYQTDGILAIACVLHENGQIQMIVRVEMHSSLLLSLSCCKFLLETHVKVACIKYRHQGIICPVEAMWYAG